MTDTSTVDDVDGSSTGCDDVIASKGSIEAIVTTDNSTAGLTGTPNDDLTGEGDSVGEDLTGDDLTGEASAGFDLTVLLLFAKISTANGSEKSDKNGSTAETCVTVS